MRRLFIAVCMMLLLAGCERDNVIQGFPVDRSDIVVGYEGDEFTINFDLLPSMKSDVQINIVQLDGGNDWIELVSSNQTSATFVVHSNLQRFERHAQIKIKNKSYSDYATINVEQRCFDTEFAEIEIVETTTATYDATVTAKDKDMCIAVFTWYLNKKQEDLEYLLDDASVIPINCGGNIVQYANYHGLDLKQCMIDNGYCGIGSVDYHAELLQQDSRYCIIVVGIEFHTHSDGYQYFTAVTPAVHKYLRTEPMSVRENLLDATVTVDSQYGSDILLSIECDQDSDLFYRYMIWEKKRTDPFIFEEHTPDEFYDYFANLWYRDYTRELSYGFENLETYMQSIGLFNSSFTDERIRLSANSEYCLVAYALDVVDGSIQIVSNIEIESIATTQPPLSDISFDCSINSIKARSVNYTITPSLANDGYYAVVMSKQEYSMWDEELLLQRLVDEGTNRGIYFGTHESEVYTSPDTDYYILCVGVHGGVATTENIVKFEFTTPSQPEPMCRITGVDILGPYHPSALYVYDSEKYYHLSDWGYADFQGYCNVATDLHYEGEPMNVYSLFLADEYVEGFDREQIIATLRSHKSRSKVYFYVMRDVAFHYYAMVEDKEGNIDLYISPEEYYFTTDNYLTSEEDIARLAALYDEILALSDAEDSTSAATSTTRALQTNELCVKESPIN